MQVTMSKMAGKLVFLFVLVAGSSANVRNVDTSCRDPWPETSSLCFYDDDPSVTAKGVSEEDKQVILDEHNKYRAAVDPPAKQMPKMYWSDELEMTAQKYAQSCKGGHDSFENREVPGWWIGIGQNGAFGYGSWAGVVAGWHNEVKLFTYGKEYSKTSSPPWDKIGHYTQVVRDVTVLVGCGYALCGGKDKTYYCNYAHSNNGNSIGLPYVKGKTCEGCPGHCSNNLCDCNGLQCLNGQLDLATCTCKCRNSYWTGVNCDARVCDGLDCKNGGTINVDSCTCTCTSLLWKGKDCSEMDRGECKDVSDCKGFFKGKCDVWSNVPTACPKMCGICTPDCNGLECVHGELDPRACTCTCESVYWTGEDCGTEVCGGLTCRNGGTFNIDSCDCSCTSLLWKGKDCSEMDRGECRDNWACKSFYKGKCNEWSNVPAACPKMCGICTPDCGGLECVHGELDPRACNCTCESELWTGEECDEIVPSKCKDSWSCATFFKGKCKTWSNAPTNCPVMCGVCTP